jgi:hypothetical protein
MIILNARQLQALAETLLRLERLLEAEGGDATGIQDGLEEAAHRMGVHLAVVRLADAGTLLHLHGPEGGGDPGRLWATAELLYLDGLRARAEGETDGGDGLLRTARRLFQAVDPGLRLPPGTPSPTERVREIGRLLGGPS